MKSFRWTFAIIGIVGALLVFTIFDYKRSTKQNEQKERAKNILHFSSDLLVKAEVESNTKSAIVLEKKDGKWNIVAPIADAADQQAVSSLLLSLTSEKAVETVSDVENADLRAFGLNEPVNRLKVITVDGKSQILKIGSIKAYDGNLYAQSEGEKPVLLISSNWQAHL